MPNKFASRQQGLYTYFITMQGMSVGLVVCFALMAFGIGVFIRNHYIGFIVFLAVNAVFVVLPLQIPPKTIIGLYVRYYSMLSPVRIWLKHSLWFTDGDIDILWAHFETWGLCVSLSVITALGVIAAIYFRKRDFA